MSGPQPASKPRGARTRDALINAGLRLFAARPIDAVPIDDIVAAAGVAKGSFFNHFDDKQAFAGAIASAIRLDIEARVARANANVHDPLERLTGGMVVAADFTLTQRDRAMVMLRGMAWATAREHPLNTGLRADIDACLAAGLFNASARRSGLQFWLGACQMLMASMIDRPVARPAAAERLCDTLTMALLGLGVEAALVAPLAHRRAADLVAAG